ncbi:MAG: helix-turn-helix domain-containing protein [Cytophagaceae bacterium]|jgi:YesN/AraC family two-component response regulator|nr:helix-turn-helix domain-containing protein [Cytophagaceae bacterium]
MTKSKKVELASEPRVLSMNAQCDELTSSDFKISSFGAETCTILEFEERHRHSYYEIIWLKNGKGVHHIDMIDFPYQGSVVFLLSPGQMHQLHAQEKAEGFIVKFLPSFFPLATELNEYVVESGLFDSVELSPVIPVQASYQSTQNELFNKLASEFYAHDELQEKIIQSYLKILLIQIRRLKNQHTSRTQPIDPDLRLFQHFKQFIEQSYRKEHSLQPYAERLHVTGRKLNQLSKRYAGKTAGGLLAERILLEAKREMYYGNHNIKEIAYQLGFEDPAYFTRFFKKHTGTSPQEFRSSQAFTLRQQQA